MYKGVNGQNYQIPQLAVPVKGRLDQLLDRTNVWPYITDNFYAIIYMKPYPDYIDRDHPFPRGYIIPKFPLFSEEGSYQP